MTTNQILMKLAAITGKTYNDTPGTQEGGIHDSPEIRPEDVAVCENESNSEDGSEQLESQSGDNDEVSNNIRQAKSHSREIVELAIKWGASISDNEKIINNSIEMSRKDFLKYSKDFTQSALLSDPLLYVMFRSEEQTQANFWDFLDKFPKDEEYESDK